PVRCPLPCVHHPRPRPASVHCSRGTPPSEKLDQRARSSALPTGHDLPVDILPAAPNTASTTDCSVSKQGGGRLELDRSGHREPDSGDVRRRPRLASPG